MWCQDICSSVKISHFILSGRLYTVTEISWRRKTKHQSVCSFPSRSKYSARFSRQCEAGWLWCQQTTPDYLSVWYRNEVSHRNSVLDESRSYQWRRVWQKSRHLVCYKTSLPKCTISEGALYHPELECSVLGFKLKKGTSVSPGSHVRSV